MVTTLNLSRDKILERMPHNVKTLKRLLERAETRFREFLRATRQRPRARECAANCGAAAARRSMLAEELSPRIELLDKWTDELASCLRRDDRSWPRKPIDIGDRSAADRERSHRS